MLFKNKSSKIVYQKRLSHPFNLIELLKFNLSKRVQTRLNKKHLAQGYRQLAVFAFDSIGLEINYFGVYEKKELQCFFDWMQTLQMDFSQMAALDIGANIGNHSLFFSDYFQAVHAFEPNPLTFGLLSYNANLSNRITAHPFGLSDTDKVCEMMVEPQNMGASTIENTAYAQKNTQQKKHIPITLKKLDDLHLCHLPVGLIKIDVEGHELSVFKGANAFIMQHQPMIVFEQLHSEIANGSSACIDFLKSVGYQLFFQPVFSPPFSQYLPVKFRKFLRLFYGEIHQMRQIESFDNQTYPFIIAIPPRFAAITMKTLN